MAKSLKKSKKRTPKDSYLFDMNYVNDNTPNLDILKTRLKKMKNKRVGLFANKQIKKGEVISYYLVKAFKKARFDSVYSVSLYNNNGSENKLYGDLCPESLQLPTKSGITYWAYFSNEPSINEHENSYLDFTNSYKETRNKTSIEEGDLVLYKLIASRNIKKGDEILWCYGYPPGQRLYKTACEESGL
jgi:hypothetical protein